MTDMTPEAAKALRAPFPKSAIGKLPKPYKAESPRGNCPECGGYHGLPAVHLDYVGHAATTDRLLIADPQWTWRTFTAEEILALPPKLRDAGLWIHLTVCGVTRPGVGDGKSAKECIGDAIRNAAMRFGVALDLWSKEELEGSHDGSEPVVPQPEALVVGSTKGQPPARPSSVITPEQLKKLHTMLSKQGITDRADGLAFYQTVLDRPVESSKHLTRAEANKIITALERAEQDDANEPPPDGDPATRDPWGGT